MTRRLLILPALLYAGCFTPTVPVPPPGPEAYTFDLHGQDCDPGVPVSECNPADTVLTVVITADPAWADAWVIIRNDDRGIGIVTKLDAAGDVVAPPIRADVGERILIGLETPEGDLAGSCYIAHDGPNSLSTTCP